MEGSQTKRVKIDVHSEGKEEEEEENEEKEEGDDRCFDESDQDSQASDEDTPKQDTEQEVSPTNESGNGTFVALDCHFNLQATSHSLKTILVHSSDPIFCVPSYQRPFVWNQSNCERLLKDLFSWKAHFEEGGGHPYYVGQVIFANITHDKFILEERFNISQDKIQNFSSNSDFIFDIVDGQQRITFFLLFISVIMYHIAHYKTIFNLPQLDVQDTIIDKLSELQKYLYINLKQKETEESKKFYQELCEQSNVVRWQTQKNSESESEWPKWVDQRAKVCMLRKCIHLTV